MADELEEPENGGGPRASTPQPSKPVQKPKRKREPSEPEDGSLPQIDLTPEQAERLGKIVRGMANQLSTQMSDLASKIDASASKAAVEKMLAGPLGKLKVSQIPSVKIPGIFEPDQAWENYLVKNPLVLDTPATRAAAAAEATANYMVELLAAMRQSVKLNEEARAANESARKFSERATVASLIVAGVSLAVSIVAVVTSLISRPVEITFVYPEPTSTSIITPSPTVTDLPTPTSAVTPANPAPISTPSP